MEKQGEIILYQPDEAVKLEVRLEDETVWLNRQQLSCLLYTSEVKAYQLESPATVKLPKLSPTETELVREEMTKR